MSLEYWLMVGDRAPDVVDGVEERESIRGNHVNWFSDHQYKY